MITVLPDWALTALDEAQIAALLARSFATDFGGRSYFQQRPHFRLIWREAGQILGHMAVMYRAVRLDGALVTVAGLADVATDPAHRGRGIAAGLLSRAVAEVRTTPAAYFLLFGTAGLYAAQGFDAARADLTYVDMQGAVTGRVVTEAAEHLRVLPLGAQAWPQGARLDLLGPLI